MVYKARLSEKYAEWKQTSGIQTVFHHQDLYFALESACRIELPIFMLYKIPLKYCNYHHHAVRHCQQTGGRRLTEELKNHRADAVVKPISISGTARNPKALGFSPSRNGYRENTGNIEKDLRSLPISSAASGVTEKVRQAGGANAQTAPPDKHR